MRRYVLALVMATAFAPCAQAQVHSSEVLENHLAQFGLAQAAGEVCNMKLRIDQIRALQAAFPHIARPDGGFQQPQIDQMAIALLAGRNIMRALPPQMRCEIAEGWFGARGSIVPLLEPK